MPGISIKTVLSDLKSTDNINGNIYGYNFYIKDYQRGYRWEEKQIFDLLQDIYDFDDNGKKLKYCLQPLVVKPIEYIKSSRSLLNIITQAEDCFFDKNNSCWELIDGQQRLTTIWLIMHCCDSRAIPYSIFYEHFRAIDNYYINNAKQTIESWFEKFGPLEEDIKYEIRSKINRSIQFIWYQVEQEKNSVDIFTKINMGKIPLTNAELFKAQLLNPDSIPYDKYDQIGDYERSKNKLEKIAFEWDYIEQSLRNDDFWYFISNENEEFETRIDYLLRLKAKQLKHDNLIEDKINETDNLFPFLTINSYLNEGGSEGALDNFIKRSEVWEDIVKLHDTLKSWSMDNELYHYIGFLVTPHAKGEKYVEELIMKIVGRKKSEITEMVINDVRSLFKGVCLEELSYNNSGDSKKIRNVLLFFNIYTMIQSKTESKFSFKLYKDKNISWDVEHIHARATDHEVQQLREVDKMKELLYGIKNQFIELGMDKEVECIDDYITSTLTEKFRDYGSFFDFYRDLVSVCGDFDENSIGNLTLLDAETNRSYHNALFPIKRKKIIERDMGEVFIPVCTKNVFLKMYSYKANDMMRWTNKDADDYLTAMKKALVEDAKICL